MQSTQQPEESKAGQQLEERQGERIMTTREAAKYIGIGESSLAHWRMHGKGPRFYKLGVAVRYYKSDIDAWLAAGIVEPRFGVK